MSRISPFIIWHPDGFPMAFPPETTFDEVVVVAELSGDGTRLVRDVGYGEIPVGEVVGNKYIEED